MVEEKRVYVFILKGNRVVKRNGAGNPGDFIPPRDQPHESTAFRMPGKRFLLIRRKLPALIQPAVCRPRRYGRQQRLLSGLSRGERHGCDKVMPPRVGESRNARLQSLRACRDADILDRRSMRDNRCALAEIEERGVGAGDIPDFDRGVADPEPPRLTVIARRRENGVLQK